LWVLVPSLQERVDGGLEVGYAAEDATADGLAIEFAKPAFDQVQPTGTGRDKVEHKARVAQLVKGRGWLL